MADERSYSPHVMVGEREIDSDDWDDISDNLVSRETTNAFGTTIHLSELVQFFSNITLDDLNDERNEFSFNKVDFNMPDVKFSQAEDTNEKFTKDVENEKEKFKVRTVASPYEPGSRTRLYMTFIAGETITVPIFDQDVKSKSTISYPEPITLNEAVACVIAMVSPLYKRVVSSHNAQNPIHGGVGGSSQFRGGKTTHFSVCGTLIPADFMLCVSSYGLAVLCSLVDCNDECERSHAARDKNREMKYLKRKKNPSAIIFHINTFLKFKR